jgi:hypothetical protein
MLKIKHLVPFLLVLIVSSAMPISSVLGQVFQPFQSPQKRKFQVYEFVKRPKKAPVPKPLVADNSEKINTLEQETRAKIEEFTNEQLKEFKESANQTFQKLLEDCSLPPLLTKEGIVITCGKVPASVRFFGAMAVVRQFLDNSLIYLNKAELMGDRKVTNQVRKVKPKVLELRNEFNLLDKTIKESGYPIGLLNGQDLEKHLEAIRIKASEIDGALYQMNNCLNLAKLAEKKPEFKVFYENLNKARKAFADLRLGGMGSANVIISGQFPPDISSQQLLLLENFLADLEKQVLLAEERQKKEFENKIRKSDEQRDKIIREATDLLNRFYPDGSVREREQEIDRTQLYLKDSAVKNWTAQIVAQVYPSKDERADDARIKIIELGERTSKLNPEATASIVIGLTKERIEEVARRYLERDLRGGNFGLMSSALMDLTVDLVQYCSTVRKEIDKCLADVTGPIANLAYNQKMADLANRLRSGVVSGNSSAEELASNINTEISDKISTLPEWKKNAALRALRGFGGRAADDPEVRQAMSVIAVGSTAVRHLENINKFLNQANGVIAGNLKLYNGAGVFDIKKIDKDLTQLYFVDNKGRAGGLLFNVYAELLELKKSLEKLNQLTPRKDLIDKIKQTSAEIEDIKVAIQEVFDLYNDKERKQNIIDGRGKKK